jgi:predicted nucleic acid-binding protein
VPLDLIRSGITTRVASALVEVELVRAIRRTDPPLLVGVPALIARVARYEMDAVVRSTAAAYPDPALRPLDAIHLATAHAMFGARRQTFVTYDERLSEAARARGLTVTAPH